MWSSRLKMEMNQVMTSPWKIHPVNSEKKWRYTYRVLTQRSPQSKLVKCQTFPTSLFNPCPCCLSEPQSCNFQCWNFIDSNIIGNSPNNDSNLTFLLHNTRMFKIPDISYIHNHTKKKENKIRILHDFTNLSFCELDKPRKGKWRLVNLAHKQALENHSIEIASSSTDKEAVKLVRNTWNHWISECKPGETACNWKKLDVK